MSVEVTMECKCGVSTQWKTFNGEIAIHFPGLDGLTKPIVWVFPELFVCLECGEAQFRIPERELQALGTGAAIDQAAA